MDIPSRIKALRLAAGLSKVEFAKELGLSVRCIDYYESGKRTPTLKRWLAINERFSGSDVQMGSKPTDSEDHESQGQC